MDKELLNAADAAEAVNSGSWDKKSYTLCEFSADDGRLIYQEGSLFERFCIELPDNLSLMKESVMSWPIANEFVLPVKSFTDILISGDSEKQNILSDFEVLFIGQKEKCWVKLSAMSIFNDDRRIIGINFTDVNEEKLNMLRLMDQAATDPLTTALNRSAVASAVNKLAEDGSSFAVIMLDVDGFKMFNDTFGHIIGDNMLVDIVDKLRHGLRREDIIGRIGGDEFMICLKDVSDRAVIEKLAKHICSLTRHSMPNGMAVSASLGIAISPRDGRRFEELYKKADIAMYGAKHSGGNTFVIYQPEMEGETEGGNNFDIRDNSVDCGVLVEFRILETKFVYPEIMSELFDAEFDSRPLWDIFAENGISSGDAAAKLKKTIEELSLVRATSVRFSEFFLRTTDGIWRWYRLGFVRIAHESRIWITLRDINEEIVSNRRLRHISEYDELTGLLNRAAFTRAVDSILEKNEEGAWKGEFALLFFDIVRFKAVNDMFGISEGNKLLLYIADIISGSIEPEGVASRLASDRFTVFLRKSGSELDGFLDAFFADLARYNLPFEIVCNVGIYVINNPTMPVNLMLDRAIIAQAAIKGSYTVRRSFYTEEMRSDMLGEQEIVGAMNSALAENQFTVYYQPQYDHSDGSLVGSEALVRWEHPERGLILPGRFIPIFEKNGFIAKLDAYVFGEVCRMLSECIEKGIKTVPVSVNLTRYDIFENGFIERMEATRSSYGVPVELLRLEITESAIFGSNERVSETIKELHRLGYIVEMDDFGSGYSSLNVLKDIDLDAIKLDMQFLSGETGSRRGGMILGAIVRMARWLELSVIAEGVETAGQADYLRSIGCNYIQGYLYKKPIPKDEYIKVVSEGKKAEFKPQMSFDTIVDPGRFWEPDSQEAFIFNHFVGAAMIFEYRDGIVEALRVNRKYVQEIGCFLTEDQLVGTNLLDYLRDDKERRDFRDMIERAIASGGEEQCDTWRKGDGRTGVCVRSSVNVIGRGENSFLVFESIRNISQERKALGVMKRKKMKKD